jgi:hypothetical protein
MKTLLLTAVLSVAVAGLAPAADSTVIGLIETVRLGLAEKQTDKLVAKSLSKLKMTERLDPVVIEQLESEGAGPETMRELDRLLEDSSRKPKMAEPLPFPVPAQPALEEMQAVIKATAAYAIGYARSLPDFLCTQTVKRYQDVGVHGFWLLKDTLTLHLGYSDQKEEYKLVAMNNRPTSSSYESVGGAISEGEFGSMMFVVFDARSHAHIFWDHWTRVRGHPAQVYSYTIKMQDSSYKLTYGGRRGNVSTMAGAAGQVYIDPETHSVLRLTRTATEMSSTFPITLASTVLDYDYGEVGGRRFFLPTHATIRMDTREVRTRNDVEFSAYRKFAGESTISFGDPGEPPIKH